MANTRPAISFDEMIQGDRKKKQQQELAQSMLGSRTASLSGRKTPTLATLSGKSGITKRSASVQPRSNIDNRWGHDLHHVNNPSHSRPRELRRTRTPLAAGTISTLERELQREPGTAAHNLSNQANIRQKAQLNIRGMANQGPFVIVASNFAPGTTAADIEAAMEPVGGEIQSCTLIASNPTVMVEILFTDKAGADNVIATFNNQKADGRLLHVYHKPGGPTPQLHPLQSATKSAKASVTPTPSAKEDVFDPPQGPRDHSSRAAAAAAAPTTLDERESMDVDENPRGGRDDRFDDRDRNRNRYRDPDSHDRNGNFDGRYGYRHQYNGRRDYGRAPRGLYSDGMHRNERRYRP